MIRETFLPRLFLGKTKTLSPIVEALRTMPVKKYGIGILNLVMREQEIHLSSQRGSAELVHVMMGVGELSNTEHLQTLSEGRHDEKKYRDSAYETKI